MTSVSRTMYPVATSMNLIAKMQKQYATLQQQLATGQKASNLAEMGTGRMFDLSIRAQQSRLSGYADSIKMVNVRLDMFDQVTSALGKMEQDARKAIVPSASGTDNINYASVPSLARTNLDQVVQLLNTDVNGRYLFSGGSADKKPVQETSALLDGANGKAGFAQVAMERQRADVGDGLGRLTLTTPATDTVTLTEDGAHPFGFKLSTLTASSSAVTLTQPTGVAPQILSVQFNAVPTAGDLVTIGLTLPDGTSTQVQLKAVTGTPGTGEFQIGADADTTATNFKTALQSSLTGAGSTTLVAASSNAAANNFFNGQGQAVQRVQPNPDFAHATQLLAADPTDTIIWYQGADSANARASVQAKVDDAQTISYGAQANESGPLNLVRSLAVLAIQNFSTADATSPGRFDAIASRNLDRMSASHDSDPGSIELMSIELGSAKTAMATTQSRHTAYGAQLDGMLSDIETVPDEEVAMQMLALQTRLQASYQATSMIANLSLVNYLK
jgi:flagellar hook-associated protein 3 FlgL